MSNATRSIVVAGGSARGRIGSQRRLSAVHITLIVGAVFMVFPFVWELLTAFKTFGGSTQVPPQIIPDPFAWNFPDAFARINVGQMTINSVIITVACTLGQIVLCTMAGYGFARIPFRGRNALFLAFLAVLMVPGQLFLVPQFEIIGQLGLLDSLPGVILPGLFSAFGVFLMRQFFMSMPAELEEAARLDGANVWQIFRRIMLPLAKPGIIALAVFGALGNWNNLLWPLIVLNTSNKFPLSVGISALSQDVHNATNYPQLLSVALIAMLPMLITFIVLQRQFIAGIAFSGGKG